jgi:NAD(P)H dehydrogenase (quinone)
MFAITGITGNVGGEAARALLAAKQPVRAVVRDARKGDEWRRQGCEVAIANIEDSAALAEAFKGVDAVFVMVPPNFDPLAGFPEAQATASSLKSAIEAARPGRVVYLSTIGAQATRINLLSQHTIIEKVLRQLSTPVTFLRPGWFIENSRWDVASARERGVIESFLQPLDKPFPMVATADIGRATAELLQETLRDHRVVELEGPERVTPKQVADTFAELLGRPVGAEVVPRDSWETLFRSQGMKNPEPRIQMLDGFNEGWIEFEGSEADVRKGNVSLSSALWGLVRAEAAV